MGSCDLQIFRNLYQRNSTKKYEGPKVTGLLNRISIGFFVIRIGCLGSSRFIRLLRNSNNGVCMYSGPYSDFCHHFKRLQMNSTTTSTDKLDRLHKKQYDSKHQHGLELRGCSKGKAQT